MHYEKVSISLPEHIYRLAVRTAELHGNNFSNYINALISKEFTEEELKIELGEISKPIMTKSLKKAEFETMCRHCKLGINVGDEIYLARFDDNSEGWVHTGCCRQK